MVTELKIVRSHLRLCAMALEERQKRLDNTTSKLSLHYNRVAHTAMMLELVQELQGLATQDPDLWEDEPDVVPF